MKSREERRFEALKRLDARIEWWKTVKNPMPDTLSLKDMEKVEGMMLAQGIILTEALSKLCAYKVALLERHRQILTG